MGRGSAQSFHELGCIWVCRMVERSEWKNDGDNDVGQEGGGDHGRLSNREI